MKRSDFLKRLGIGLGVIVVAPKTLFAEKDKISIGDTNAYTTPEEILKLYKQTGKLPLTQEGLDELRSVVLTKANKNGIITYNEASIQADYDIQCRFEKGMADMIWKTR